MTRPIDIVDLRGSPYERGRMLGIARRAEIGSCLYDWLASLKGAGLEAEDYLSSFRAATAFDKAIGEHCPHLLEEVAGISDGVRQPGDLVYSAQLMDEEWAYRGTVRAASPAGQKCSSVAIRSARGSVVIGQNMDLGGYTDGHQIVFRIASDGVLPGALVFSLRSMIALMGVNTRGIAVCVNSLPQLPSARHGLPVAFMIRKLLEANTLREAVDTVQRVPHATGQHYLIGSATEIRSFEASPTGVHEYRPSSPARCLHTNHPLAPGLIGSGTVGPNTIGRLESLARRLARDSLDLQSIKDVLSSRDPPHPVCKVYEPDAVPSANSGMISFTTGSMISELGVSAAAIESWISSGPPCERGYVRTVLPGNCGNK